MDAFETTPRLAIVSAEKREGKSRILNLTQQLVKDPLASMNITPAALYTAVKKREPTLLSDETDNIFNGNDNNGELLGLLNACFQRGQKVFRCSYDAGQRELEELSAFCPILFAGIDKDIPDTLVDRSIVVHMKRRCGEPLEPWRERDTREEASKLKSRLEEWAKSVLDRAKTMRPKMPEGIEDRNADKWEPMFIVAGVSDPDVTDVTSVTDTWGHRVRVAALAFLAAERDDEISAGIRLLTDIYNVVLPNGKKVYNKIATSHLIEQLTKLEESHWWDARWEKPLIDARKLSNILKPYEVRPKTVRIDGKTWKGYDCDELEPVFKRYGIGRDNKEGQPHLRSS
jgi:hypothetical protein